MWLSKINFDFLKDKHIQRTYNKNINNWPWTRTTGAGCVRVKCLFPPGYSSPYPSFVSTVCWHLIMQNKQNIWYDPWHWAATLFKYIWKFLCSYCSIADWQHRSGWYSGALYTESDESSFHTATESFQVSSNIIPLIYNHTRPSEFQIKFCSSFLIIQNISHSPQIPFS
jgi:hypothetical protein